MKVMLTALRQPADKLGGQPWVAFGPIPDVFEVEDKTKGSTENSEVFSTSVESALDARLSLLASFMY